MIKGILFDAGDTLVKPKAGEWFSDNWPSLDRRFRVMGLRSFFDAFVISALVGSSKPCERIYRVAVEEIGVPPEHLALVDDRPVNVAAAEKIGMKGVVISRYGNVPDTDLTVISNLDALIAIVVPETAAQNATDP